MIKVLMRFCICTKRVAKPVSMHSKMDVGILYLLSSFRKAFGDAQVS